MKRVKRILRGHKSLLRLKEAAGLNNKWRATLDYLEDLAYSFRTTKNILNSGTKPEIIRVLKILVEIRKEMLKLQKEIAQL